jgi:hypothetical protein
MNKNRLFVLLVALALLAVAILTVEPNIATSATVPGAQALSNNSLPNPGAAVEKYFPGKAQDDLVTAGAAIDRLFPGKEKDDIVAPISALDRQFPGKVKDDIVAPISPLDRQFPGKAKDDLFVITLP